MKALEAILAFTQAAKTKNNEDLLADLYELEIQMNVRATGSTPDGYVFHGERVEDTTGTFSDGPNTWWPIRVPKDANDDPHWEDYQMSFPPEVFAEGIGSTGWGWRARKSRRGGFDFDTIAGHAEGVGISDDELALVKEKAKALPYVQARNSTGGKGVHLYVYFEGEGIPTANHNEHAALCRLVLAKMSADVGYPFAEKVDCAGGNMWVWHRKATLENEGLKIIKEADRSFRISDLPADWQEQIKRPAPKKAKATTQKRRLLRDRNPVDADFCAKSDFEFLVDAGWGRSGDTLTRPGTNKSCSARIVTAEDGTRLLHVFSTSAEPYEADTNYNAFTAYTLLHFDGDYDAARLDLMKQGYGCKPVKIHTCKDLDGGDFALEYLIENTLVARQPCFIAGPKKALKTTFLVDMALSLATGKPFLGSLAVKQKSKVIILSGESGMGTLQETVRRICKAKGLRLPDVENLIWSEFLPMFDDWKDLIALERLLLDTGCKVLIVDPTYLCMTGTDAANLFFQGRLLRSVNEMCQPHGVTLILAHHTRKRGKTKNASDYGPPELDDMAWAGFAEFARQWLLIGRREDYVQGSGSHKVWLSIGGSVGHSALWAVNVEEGVSGLPRVWNVELQSPSTARTEKKSNSIRDRLLDAMKNLPAGDTKTGIFTVAGLRSDAANRAVFDTLVEEKVLVECQVKKKNVGYNAYRLAEGGGAA